jgi:hypothetical protein
MQVLALTVRTMPSPRSSEMPNRRRKDAVQDHLVNGYSLRGGLASAGELIELMRPHWRQPSSVLTRWMQGHKVISFKSRALTLLPLFQFERPRFVPLSGVADAAHEIADLMSEEDLATWFLHPSEWLEHESPADVVSVDPELVLSAAQRTRHALMVRRFAN